MNCGFEILGGGKSAAEAHLVSDVEDLVKLRAAEVGVDQQDAPPVERKPRRQVAGDRGLAIARAGARHQQAARRIQRCRMLKSRAKLPKLLGDHRMRRIEDQ